MSSASSPSLASPPDLRQGRFARLGGAVKLLFACLVVFVTCGPSVDAQEENAASFFRADRERLQTQRRSAPAIVVQRPTRMIRRAAPVPGFARVIPHAPREYREPTARAGSARSRSEPARPPEVVPAQPLEAALPAVNVSPLPPSGEPVPEAPKLADAAPLTLPQTPPKAAEAGFTITVIGDSLGQLLGQGLSEAFADRTEVNVQRRARENTGLARDDYFDWTRSAREIAGALDKVGLVVMMIGSNDRQVIREANASVELRGPRWLQVYGDRVEAIAQAFRDRKIPMLWIGLPVMKNDRFSADMAAFNEIFKERATRAGAIFVDAWEPFLDDRGLYAAYGPDVNGQFQKLRSADGVHFTRPGARKLAYFLESEVRRAIDNSRLKIDLEVAAVPPPARPAAGASAAPDGGAIVPPASDPQRDPLRDPVRDALIVVPLPPAPALVAIPVKPPEGAIVALTTPIVSPGGQLIARARPTPGGDAQALIDRVLVQGRPLDPRPGRADDFAWPRR